MTECDSKLPYEFSSPRRVTVQFSDLQLSSDAGILLARQAEEQLQVCHRLAHCIAAQTKPISRLMVNQQSFRR